MKRIKYSKYVPDPAGEMSMEDLLSALSDYLLQSGFQDYGWYELPEGEHTLDELRQMIEQALLDSELLDDEMRERLQQMQMEGKLDELIEQLIERMQQEDYISIDQPHDPAHQSSVGGQVGEVQQQAKFEITDKSLDFLGFKTLRDLAARHTRPRDRRRSQRGLQRVRIWRHSEPGHHCDLVQRDTARGTIRSTESGVLRFTSAPMRVPVVLCDRAHAGLLTLHDFVRRRSFHAGEESRHGVVPLDPRAISGRFSFAHSFS